MSCLQNLLLLTVLLTITAINGQVSNNFSQFGLFVDNDQIVRRNPNFVPGSVPVPTSIPVTVTSTTAGPATTASPQYLACWQGCSSTQEYNPVCGSDMINYHNIGRLSCAQRCGKDVQMVRLGTCLPL